MLKQFNFPASVCDTDMTQWKTNIAVSCLLCAIGWGFGLQAGRSRVQFRWGHWNFSLA